MSLPIVTLSPSETNYIITSLSHQTTPTRADLRSPLASRPIEISYGVFPHANGSARVNVGGTEVIAGIKLEVVDVKGKEKQGEESWRSRVEVDVTPQAFPTAQSSTLSTVSTQLASFISTHFTPSISALPIVPNQKYFQANIHLTVLSSNGNVPTSLILAARAAFADLQVPKTKVITWTGTDAGGEDGSGAGVGADGVMGKGDLSGIKAAIQVGKGKGKGKYVARGGEDWDLDMDDGEGTEYLNGRESLPVLVTLNLVPNSPNIFLDATPQEESGCPSRLHLFFRPRAGEKTGDAGLTICGMRMEGPEGLDSGRVRGLVEQGSKIALELLEEVNKSIPQ
ncbi:hypothetical protein I317_06636 [Kwoniella heveanensis CBS 569]|nr:hypothetical protein I317_06636 [Kwoniella heveanensis CBS 569]